MAKLVIRTVVQQARSASGEPQKYADMAGLFWCQQGWVVWSSDDKELNMSLGRGLLREHWNEQRKKGAVRIQAAQALGSKFDQL
jgi:hypothetical protein